MIAASALAITLPIVSCSSSTSDDLTSDDVKLILINEVNVVTNITKSLRDEIESGANNDEQVQIINSWKVDSSIPTSALDSIKDILKFKDSDNKEFGYDDVVKSVTFNSKTEISSSGSITSPKLKVNFKDGYSGNIIITVGDLGSVVPIVLTVDDSVMQNTINAITTSLTTEMQKDGNKRKQIEIAEKWAIGSEVSREHLDSIRGILKFKNGSKEVSFDNAVNTITFTSETTIGNFNTIIDGPTLRINFKDGYTGNISIKANSLGNVAATRLTIDTDVMENVVNAVTESLTNKMQTFPGGTTSRTLQENLAAEWLIGKEVPMEELDLIKNILVFNDGDNYITYDEVVQSITFDSETIIGEFDTNIEGPTLKINFNDGYNANASIKIGSLGKVDAIQVSLLNSNISQIIAAANNSLTQLMDVAGDDRNIQLDIANSWLVGSEIPEVILESMMPLLQFEDQFSGLEYEYNEVIESFVFDTAASVPPTGGNEIIGPSIKAIFKNGYKGNIDFATGTIGISGWVFVTPEEGSLNNVIASITSSHANIFRFNTTRIMQENSASNIRPGISYAHRDIITFIDSRGNIYIDNNNIVVKDWIVHEGFQIPPTGQPIKGPIIRIILNDGFMSDDDILIEVGIIGIAL